MEHRRTALFSLAAAALAACGGSPGPTIDTSSPAPTTTVIVVTPPPSSVVDPPSAPDAGVPGPDAAPEAAVPDPAAADASADAPAEATTDAAPPAADAAPDAGSLPDAAPSTVTCRGRFNIQAPPDAGDWYTWTYAVTGDQATIHVVDGNMGPVDGGCNLPSPNSTCLVVGPNNTDFTGTLNADGTVTMTAGSAYSMTVPCAP